MGEMKELTARSHARRGTGTGMALPSLAGPVRSQTLPAPSHGSAGCEVTYG